MVPIEEDRGSIYTERRNHGEIGLSQLRGRIR
jgi:hypothetical protein